MDLLPTSEQQQIIDSAAAYLSDRMPLQRLKALSRTPELPAATQWKEIAELGWLGLGLDPAIGGVGYGPSEEVLLFREIGRVAGAPRFIFTVIAAHVAAASGNAELAEQLTGGHISAALAIRDSRTEDAPDGDHRLYEPGGANVAVIVNSHGARLLDITTASIEARPCMDTSLGMGVADLSAAEVLCQVAGGQFEQRGALLLAAYQVGLAERALDMIVEYAKIRETFGRPIGAYQAVRHPCAEMATRAEEAKAQLFLASVIVAGERPDSALQVSAARVLAEHAALQNTDDNIQLHGGIGVTDEFDAHFLMKRATVSRQWFGDSRAHLSTVLDAPTNFEAA